MAPFNVPTVDMLHLFYNPQDILKTIHQHKIPTPSTPTNTQALGVSLTPVSRKRTDFSCLAGKYELLQLYLTNVRKICNM